MKRMFALFLLALCVLLSGAALVAQWYGRRPATVLASTPQFQSYEIRSSDNEGSRPDGADRSECIRDCQKSGESFSACAASCSKPPRNPSPPVERDPKYRPPGTYAEYNETYTETCVGETCLNLNWNASGSDIQCYATWCYLKEQCTTYYGPCTGTHLWYWEQSPTRCVVTWYGDVQCASNWNEYPWISNCYVHDYAKHIDVSENRRKGTGFCFW